MADPWADFDGTPAATPGVMGARGGTAPSGQRADPWAAFDGTPTLDVPVAGAPVVQPGQRTGLMANAGAALQEGGAGLVNIASDPFGHLIGKPLVALGTGAYNLGARAFGYQPLSPEKMDLLLNDGPGPGDRMVAGLNAAGGAPNPSDVVPGTAAERYLRAGIGGAIGMAALGPVGGVRAAAGTLATGALSGAGSQAAQDVLPADLAPAGGVLGGIVAPMVPAVAGAGVRAVTRPLTKALADYAAPMVGKPNALMDSAGQAFVSPDSKTLMATPNQARLAGQDLARSATDLPAARAAAGNVVENVPGENPTTFQATRDPKLGTLEAETKNGAGKDLFLAREAQQNDARVAQLRTLPGDADKAALPAEAVRQADAVDTRTAADVQSAQTAAQRGIDATQTAGETSTAAQTTAAQQAGDQLGGNLPSGSDATVGAALRAPAQSASDTARTVRGRMYDAVAPDGGLNVDIGPVQAAAARLRQEQTAFSGDAPPLRARLMAQLDAAPGVVPYEALRDLQSQVSQGMREAKMAGDLQEHRRLSILRQGVEDALSQAAAEPAAAAAKPDAVPVAAPNVGSNVYTASGQRVGVRYELADAGSLVTSHNADMTPNPAFPPELQPRQRDRAASALQVQNIANKLEPERLGASSTATDGAPIVGPDGIVESGNGRVMALRQAYEANGPQAQSYRDWLAGQGHDATGMQQPVLVRRRTSDMTPDERVAFTDEGSRGSGMPMSASEQAALDAKRLTPDVLDAHQGGDVTQPDNRDFVRSFARNIIDPGETNAFAGADGTVSQAGATRMRSALAQRAYGDAGLTAMLTEATDPAAKVLIGAMQDAAGPMARLRAGIERGDVDPAMNLAPALTEAAGFMQRAKAAGLSLADAVAQRDAFNPLSSSADAILRAAYGDNLAGRMSQAKMTTLLEHYAEEAQRQQATAGLFGDRVTSSQVLDGAVARYGKDAATEVATGTTGRAGPGFSANRDRASGFGPDAAGAQTSGGSGRAVLPEPAPEKLTANFDADAAGRLRDANAQHAQDIARFRTAPGVGDALKPGPTAGTYAKADAAVPNIIVKVGPAGADTARAYLAAGGSPQALADAGAFSLRQAAMGPDGLLNINSAASWLKGRQSFLSQTPELRQAIQTAVDARAALDAGQAGAAAALKDATKNAQTMISDATARRTVAIKDMQSTALGQFLGDAEPSARIGQMLSDKVNGAARVQQLVSAVKGNPDALGGARAAALEWVQRELIGDGKTANGIEPGIKSATFQAFLRKSGPALDALMTPEQMQGMRSVAASLERSSLKATAGVGSQTGQVISGRWNKLVNAIGDYVLPSSGASLGGAIGSLAGPAGIGVGIAVGGVAGKVMQSMREGGLANVEALKTQAMLNPALFHMLTTPVSPRNEASLMAGLAAQLRRVAIVSGAQNGQRQNRP